MNVDEGGIEAGGLGDMGVLGVEIGAGIADVSS